MNIQKRPGADNTGPAIGTGIPSSVQAHYTIERTNAQIRTDRIDFVMLPDGRVTVTKMHQTEDRLRDITHGHEVKPVGFDMDEALTWCRANGFTVMWWWNVDGRKCARAWKGEPWPVRRNWEIANLRKRLEQEWVNSYRHNSGWYKLERLLSMDLAFAG
jgi:hypothetical protein